MNLANHTPDPMDRMAALERIRTRLEQEYRDACKVREANRVRLFQLEEELTTIDRALDWERKRP
jgi:hypothetical protein